MTPESSPNNAKPWLVLGSSGRIGTGLQRLVQAGIWPGPIPTWQTRPRAETSSADAITWDILAEPPPDFGDFQGIVCLAGVVSGDVTRNTDLALAAIELARQTGRGPVLLTSSAAVYGRPDCVASEQSPCHPVTNYGRAKLAMEQAVAARLSALGPAAPEVCILRIGNVAGTDALLMAAAQGMVILDRFDDGQGPERSYIGMLTLVRVIRQLFGLGNRSIALPPVLNIAASKPQLMTELLQAAGLHWDWKPSPPEALRRLVLDTARLDALIAPEPLSADPAEIIRQARCIGWAPR